jgi:hypothetical protein
VNIAVTLSGGPLAGRTVDLPWPGVVSSDPDDAPKPIVIRDYSASPTVIIRPGAEPEVILGDSGQYEFTAWIEQSHSATYTWVPG